MTAKYSGYMVQAIEMVQTYAARFVLNKFDRYANLTEMITYLDGPL